MYDIIWILNLAVSLVNFVVNRLQDADIPQHELQRYQQWLQWVIGVLEAIQLLNSCKYSLFVSFTFQGN